MKKALLLVLLIAGSMFVCGYTLDCEYAVTPQYSYAGSFVNGAALVTRDDETAVINRMGETVIGFDSRTKRIRSNGLIMVVGDNGMGAFFNQYGEQLTDYIYDTYPTVDPKWGTKQYNLNEYDGDGKSDLVPFSRGNKYGYINSWGTEIIPPVYEYAYGFVDGVAMICADGVLSEYGTYTNGKYGFILENGTEILPADSYWVAGHSWKFDYAVASNDGGVPDVLIDRDGQVAKTDGRGYARIDSPYIEVQDPDGRKGIADRWGGLVIPWGNYEDITYLHNGFFILDYKTLVNDTNEVIYTAEENVKLYPMYINIYDKSPFIRASRAEDQWGTNAVYGILNTEGEWVMELKYDTLYDMGEELICGTYEGKTCLYDYAGRMICEIGGTHVGSSVKGMFSVYDPASEAWGYMINPLLHPKVYIDGVKLTSDVLPVIESGRTLVPMRAAFESFGAEVFWDGEVQEVTAVKGDVTIKLTIGELVLYKNGEPIPIDVPAKIEESRTLIPLRAVSDSLGYEVLWDGDSHVVNIHTK